MKLIKTFLLAVMLAIGLGACGQRVDISSGEVGKILGKDGYQGQILQPSKFRLDPCMNYCDKLVVLDASDRAAQEDLELVMPKDKLKMSVRLQLTLGVNPDKYEEIYKSVRPDPGSFESASDQTGSIDWVNVYRIYAQQIIRTEAREYLSRYTIDEILSNLDKVNRELSAQLTKSISAKTPFVPRFVGLANITYPKIIVDAQEKAAERREAIAQEEAQLAVSKVQQERKLQEQQMMRKVEVAKAESDAEVSRIQARAMTPEYVKSRELDILEKMAASPNKVFVPVGSLNSMAVQSQIGR